MSGGEYRDPASFTVGSKVAGYRLEEQIGRGGMAVVYRARDVQLGRNVALKLLSPVLALDDAFRQRFIRESRAAAAADHPYIIPIFAAGESDGVLFIAMRYVQGGDVRRLIDAEGPLPPDRAAGIITQVALALDAAHVHGLVHRDIKPANMLLDSVAGSGQRDHVYLADFGLSKRSLSATGLTSIGQFLGTPAYVAPEQVEGRPVDSRADQYALACASFEILSGAPPYERDDDLAVMWAHVSMPPPSLSERRPSLPVAADAVLAKAMAKAPADRYPTCIAFALALRQALGAQVEPAGLTAAGPEPPPAVGSGPAAGAPGEPAGRPGPPPHPATEISLPRPGPEAGSAAAPPPLLPRPYAPRPVYSPRPERPSPTSRDAPASPRAEPQPATPYEPPTEDGWLPPLRPFGADPAGPGSPAGGSPPRQPPPYQAPRRDPPPAGAPGREPLRRDGQDGAPGPDRTAPAWKRWRWSRRGAVVIGCAVLAGIAAGAVLGLHGGTGSARTAGSPRGAKTPAAVLPPLPVPGCSTAVASASALSGVRSANVSVGPQPFGVVTTPDGHFSFVTMANSVAVLSDSSSLAPTLDHVLSAPGADGSEQLTSDGKYLLVAANSGAIVFNVADAEQGSSAIVGTLTSPFGSGAVEVAISPDDRFAFVTLEGSADLAVFNLQSALANGFGPSDVVGKIPLYQQPIGLAISPDHRWLYATSRMRTPTTGPSEGTLTVIDLDRAETAPSSAVVATAEAGCSPVRVVPSPDGRYVWVTSRESDMLLGFSAAALRTDPAHALVARVNVGAAPIGLALADGGSRILVADSNLFDQHDATTGISVISTSAATSRRPALLGQISTGLLPREFSLEPGGRTALVTNYGSGLVQAIDLSTLP